MVDRIERKSLLKQFRYTLAQENKEKFSRPTRTQQLRSQSQLHQQHSAAAPSQSQIRTRSQLGSQKGSQVANLKHLNPIS